MSASLAWIAWKREIGWPNARRCFAYASAWSSAPCASPTPIAATPMRPMSSTWRNCLKPLPRGPSRFSSGTRQPSKLNGRVSDAFQPILRYGSPCS
jgi:hypothetical protein